MGGAEVEKLGGSDWVSERKGREVGGSEGDSNMRERQREVGSVRKREARGN